MGNTKKFWLGKITMKPIDKQKFVIVPITVDQIRDNLTKDALFIVENDVVLEFVEETNIGNIVFKPYGKIVPF